MAKTSKRVAVGEAPRLGSSLGDALARSGVGVSIAPPLGAGTTPSQGGLDLSRCAKLVLRRERKGRGGKTVTVLAGLAAWLSPHEREQLARELRQALGCGSALDGDEIVLQGDLGERAAAWLEKRGVRRVVAAG